MTPNPQIIIDANPTGLATRAADYVARSARDAVKEKGRFLMALSGGSTPRSMHRKLAEEPYVFLVPWRETHLFWVDERCVPQHDKASNYGAAKRDFLEKVPIPGEQVHPMPGEVPPEEGARQYQGLLTHVFRLKPGQFPIFDLIILGMGRDGHTASLLPGQGALEEREKLVMAVKGGNPDVSRLTLTYPVLNRAAKIIFLCSGKAKADTLKRIFESSHARLPAQRISPINGRLIWLIDQDAASQLSKEVAHDVSEQ